jgi:hypothetical protein
MKNNKYMLILFNNLCNQFLGVIREFPDIYSADLQVRI